MVNFDFRNRYFSIGITAGSVIAVILSWMVNHSILWCIVHGICSWLYVFYWLLKHSGIH
jgi:hypothetical protein